MVVDTLRPSGRLGFGHDVGSLRAVQSATREPELSQSVSYRAALNLTACVCCGCLYGIPTIYLYDTYLYRRRPIVPLSLRPIVPSSLTATHGRTPLGSTPQAI
jgi:hypothetical protein